MSYSQSIQFYKSGSKTILNDIKKNQEKINKLIPGYKFENFSYPRGEQTFRSKFILRKEYKSARGVNEGMNVDKTDFLNLHAFELAEKPLTTIFALIDQAVEKKAWLIFYTHDVCEDHSIYGCSPEYFESVIKYCHDKQIKVRTINKVIDQVMSSGKS